MTALTLVDGDPPPGRIERVPSRPPQADAWVDGEWVLRHGRWYWLLGRWVRVPPGATYSPWVAVRSTDGSPWYAPSVWPDAKGDLIDDPPALSFATASTEAVVDPDGQTEETGRTIKTAPAQQHPASPTRAPP